MKRQNINLYHEEFRRERSWLSFRVAGFASLAVLAIISLVAAQAQIERDHTMAEKQRLESQLALLKSEVTTIKQTMTSNGVRPETLNRIKDVKAELAASESMMSSLGLQSENTFKGFSPYMKALSSRHIKGLWLTDFYVNEVDQELILMGKARRAELLPSYLKALSAEAVFQGRKFNAFRLTENADKKSAAGVLDFIVSTRDTVKPLTELLAAGE